MTTTGTNGSTISDTNSYIDLPKFDIDYQLHAKVFNQKGDLVYEYNPFHNMRDSTTGALVDFNTTDLGFSLNNPIDVEIQPSYDGTINLILNDDLNPPRIINSRFTPVEGDRYEVVDRVGNSDTNIYNQDDVDALTRLYKTTKNIPYVVFNGLSEGGALQAGNYVFYFKYADADGNESDIVAESGIVSCYVGKLNDPFSTRGGLANELTNKIAKLTIANLDTSYDYLNIYFTRSTGDYAKQEIVEAYKILTRKTLTGNAIDFTITGFEDTQAIDVSDLNLQYNVVDSVGTSTQVQNMLFFANVNKPTIPYTELQDLALRIYPTIDNSNNIGYLDEQYKPTTVVPNNSNAEYYDAVNVYNYTGYWNKEMYRFGVVFILKDDTLTPVFNVRGKNNLGKLSRVGTFSEDIATEYTYVPLYDGENNREYVNFDDSGFVNNSSFDLENTKGVIRIAYEQALVNKDDTSGIYPISVNFNVEASTLTELAKYIKGYFFVRQKRIPTILCQGLSIGVDNISFIPSIKAQITQGSATTTAYIAESYLDKSVLLVHDFSSRVITNTTGVVTPGGLLCPEAQLRSEYFNEIFTGALFNISKAPFSCDDGFFTQDVLNERHFFVKNYEVNGATTYLYKDVKLTNIEDNQPMRYSGTKRFSTRAGIPEEAFQFSWFGVEDKSANATNLVRGAFGGFVGTENFGEECMLVDIHIPGYDLSEMRDYFLLRSNSFHPYFACSDRYDLSLLTSATPYNGVVVQVDNTVVKVYRGDCFINSYTTRIVRNFQDPETPINNTIIDSLTWQANYTGYTPSGGLDPTKIAKINRGDVNAVNMGHWATFKVCSNINLAYRAIDESQTAEYALTGNPRAFFPLTAMSASGESKIPESTTINVGYDSTTSDKVYIGLPDVPYIKNIFDNRIMYSQVHINDAFRNGYRVFDLSAYRDVTRQYGPITKITEWNNNLLVVFEDGVAMIPINEKMIGGQGSGGNAYIISGEVLPNIVNVLSTNYGSTWKDSIIKTPNWVYGVDAIAKKIWRTNGNKFEVISDFKVQKFLNDNITLKEKDNLPLVALRNIKGHYNAFKQDLMFTYYDNNSQNIETKWSLCFNEQLETWITRFSWIPLASDDIANIYFSFDRESAKDLALVGYSLKDNPASSGIVLDHAQIDSTAANSIVGTLSLKGYDYYKDYTQTFTLDPSFDHTHFTIVDDEGVWHLKYNGGAFAQYHFTIRVKVVLTTIEGEQTVTVQTFYDYLGIVANRANLDDAGQEAYDTAISDWFWKHGQAGIFDDTTVILPTNWYGVQQPFEYEFIVVDNPTFAKVYDNLRIISNDAEPDSFTFTVVGDSYLLDRSTPATYESQDTYYKSNYDSTGVTTYQKGLDLKTLGRRVGNMHYKQDFWDIEIRPFRYTPTEDVVKEARIRDKYCRIRVSYTGTKLAIITALNTTYTQTYA